MNAREVNRHLIAMKKCGVGTTLCFYGSQGAKPLLFSAHVGRWFKDRVDMIDLALDDPNEAVALGWEAVASLDSRRISGEANPGEGDFVKYLGRA